MASEEGDQPNTRGWPCGMTKRASGTSWLISGGPSQKPLVSPNGNKKGWLLVCELMPGHHDNEIAAAEGKMDIREACVINEAFYVGIISTGEAQTRPVISRTPPATLATPVASKATKRSTRTHGLEHRNLTQTHMQRAREGGGVMEEDARTNTTQHHQRTPKTRIITARISHVNRA
jgi:hypothetical protein